MIVEKINEVKLNKIRQYPINSWRASMVGHPCERFLIYERTRWQDKKLHSIDLQYIFDLGDEFEKIVLKDLREAGFKVIQQQRDFSDLNLNLTGHIEGLIEIEGKYFPLEIKSCSEYNFNSINSYDDFKKSKKIWIRNYPVQLNLYLYFTNKENGVFILVNKQSGQYKEIWINFDWDLVDEVIKKVQRLNEYLKNNQLPDKINDPSLCINCAYNHICLPDILQEGQVNFSEEDNLKQLLQRWEELKVYADEFKKIDEEIKQVGKAMSKDITIIGEWVLKREIREYETKPQPAKKIKSVIIKIEKLNES